MDQLKREINKLLINTKANIKIIHSSLLLLIVFATACNNLPAESTEVIEEKPNIVLLFTDDQTYATIQALGHEEIYTPHLNRLVNKGTTFTHAYNMGGWNGAVCVASRSMMVSGEYIWNAQQKASAWRAKDSLALQQTWPQLLSHHGYQTYMTGKWHVAAPAQQIFDTVKHVRPGMPKDRAYELGAAIKKWKHESGDMKDWNDYMPVGYGRPLSADDTEWLPTDTIHGGFWKGGKHWSEVVRDDALEFIDDASRHENPFFMYLAFNAPHDPRQAPQEYQDMYPLENIALPKSFLPEYPWKEAIGNPPGLRDEALAPFPRTEYAVKKHRQEYYAIITHLDEQIGKILDALEASGELEDTYIFMTSDHGLSVGHHGLLGKQSLYDHSIRVPLIVMGPGVPEGKTITQDVYLQDIMPSSLQLAGAEIPSYIEFKSFVDLLQGKSDEKHYNAIYGAYMGFQRMIRKDGYKLIVYPKINKVLLYDLENDPYEMTDLAADPEYGEKVRTLFNELIQLQKEMNDPLSLEEAYRAIVDKT